MRVDTTERMAVLGEETIEKCEEYFNECATEHGKHGYVWVKNDETDQLVVYTRGEYTDKIIAFLETLD